MFNHILMAAAMLYVDTTYIKSYIIHKNLSKLCDNSEIKLLQSKSNKCMDEFLNKPL